MDAPYTDETAADFTAGPQSALPTDYGVFTIRSYTHQGITHVSMALGDPQLSEAPLVRVHSECLTGDALGSHRCDCGDQLTAALAAIESAGRACWFICVARKAAESGWKINCRPTRYRIRQGWIRLKPTWPWDCPTTPDPMMPPPRFLGMKAAHGFGCCPRTLQNPPRCNHTASP